MMKKLFVILIAILFAYGPSSVLSDTVIKSESDLIVQSYSFNNPVIEKDVVDNFIYDKITIKDAPNCGNTGEPSLPGRGAYILIPPNSKIVDIIVEPSEEIYLGSNYNIAPVAEMYSINAVVTESKLEENHDIYKSNQFVPEELFTKLGQFNCNGYKILILKLHPVKYCPLTGDLSYYKTLEVKVFLDSDTLSNIQIRNSLNDKYTILNKVDNPEVISTYETDETPSCFDENYEFVIITSEELKNVEGTYSFQGLKNKRISQGITTKIVTVEEIISNKNFWHDGLWGDCNPDNPFFIGMSHNCYLHNDTPAKIRNFIRYAYMNWGTEYVLLGGDIQIVPARYYHCESWTIPADIYYSCLDGSCNNVGNVNSYGSPSKTDIEQVDLLAEVYVGRACVDNKEDLYNFTYKTLKYEETSSEDSYLRNVLFLGEMLNSDCDIYGGNYIDQLDEGSSYGGYETVGFSNDFYKIFKLYEKDDWWTDDDLVNRLNNPFSSIHIINHLGHSQRFGNMKLEIEDISRLRNDDYFFVYSQGCLAGAFHDEYGQDCFAEEITVKTKNGAFAGIWNTQHGFYNSEDKYDGPSNKYHREFWDAIFKENITELGRANQDSKEDNLWRIDDTYFRVSYFEITLFGDPTLFLVEPDGEIKSKNTYSYNRFSSFFFYFFS